LIPVLDGGADLFLRLPVMAQREWTTRDLPRLDGKTIAITGANSGIGFEAARALAGTGAHVVMACRTERSANDAVAKIRAEHGGASVEFAALDLSSLASVRAFAAAFAGKHERLDVLINNAGVMALPYHKTPDGFEMQVGTNHFGHFALTGLLLDRLVRSGGARVVTVSSMAHALGKVTFDDLQREKSYERWSAYGQSKLCNLLFAYELDRRLSARGLDVRSVVCHPGYASTNLQYAAARMAKSSVGERFWRWVNGLFAQSPAGGALPTLFAAVADEARGGDYIGPGKLFGLRGSPVKVKSNARSHDQAVAKQLWEVSETLTGVSYSGVLGH